MYKHTTEKIFNHKLPLFGVECFGSALIDTGRFSQMTGMVPSPSLLGYKNGEWFVNEDWARLLRGRLNAEPGSWVMSLVEASDKTILRAISNTDPFGAPEIVANGLCELYGVVAPPMMVMELLGSVLEQRIHTLLDHSGIKETDRDLWMKLFAYPSRKTEVSKERESFFDLAHFVRTHPLDRSTRHRVGEYVRQHAHLGVLTPLGRPFSFGDMMTRISQLDVPPLETKKEEATSRSGVIKRVEDFMRLTGLDAVDRDALRAYSAVSYWKLHLSELLAKRQIVIDQAVNHLASKLSYPLDAILWMRPEELIGLMAHPNEALSSEEVIAREKKDLGVLFVEDMVSVNWG
ncbi:MAG: hypothetical protein O2877_00375 [bacterium]|nr:hypothetical protein [bacterium]